MPSTNCTVQEVEWKVRLEISRCQVSVLCFLKENRLALWFSYISPPSNRRTLVNPGCPKQRYICTIVRFLQHFFLQFYQLFLGILFYRRSLVVKTNAKTPNRLFLFFKNEKPPTYDEAVNEEEGEWSSLQGNPSHDRNTPADLPDLAKNGEYSYTCLPR